MSALTSIHVRASPATAGPRKNPDCIENVSQPIARPIRARETDSVTALKMADCWIPAARPPMTDHRKRGITAGVAAIATCEPAARISDKPSRLRTPNLSTSTPAGRARKAATIVVTENRAPTSNRLAPRSWA